MQQTETKENNWGEKKFLFSLSAVAGFTLTGQLCIPQGRDFYPVFVTVLLPFSPGGGGNE